jgi:hypothetical protein
MRDTSGDLSVTESLLWDQVHDDLDTGEYLAVVPASEHGTPELLHFTFEVDDERDAEWAFHDAPRVRAAYAVMAQVAGHTRVDREGYDLLEHHA